MKVSELQPAALSGALRRGLATLQIGMYTVRVRSPITAVAKGLGLMYADYPIALDADFADFHISLQRPKNVRRWFGPQVNFRFDNYRPFKPLPADQAFPFLEWGLNWCVSTQYHRYLVLHAAVVEKAGCALILPAPPGSGKSTLCAALVTRGWRLLSDELTLLSLNTGEVMPMCRPISLKNASIAVIQNFAPGVVMGPAVNDTSKGTVAHMRAPSESVGRSLEPAHPKWIVFPQYEAGAATELSSHGRASAFMKLADNSFNYSMLGLQGFETVGRLVAQCHCYDFRYSDLNQAIALFDSMALQSNPGAAYA